MGLSVSLSPYHFNFSVATARCGRHPQAFDTNHDTEFPLEAVALFPLSYVSLSSAGIPNSGEGDPLPLADMFSILHENLMARF